MPDFDIKKEMDKLYINMILKENANLNFIQRLLYPNVYPNIDNPDLGPSMGNYSTHFMSYDTDDKGNAYVYPQIIQDPVTGTLIKLDSGKAAKHAKQTGEFIKFNNAEDADWFSKNYKKIWEE